MTMIYADREVRCRVCGRMFVFSAGEQQYFGRRGFQTPSRCPDCRTGPLRRGRDGAARWPGPAAPEPPPLPAAPAPPRTWEVTCFRCGAPTHLPFLPREDAMAYCRACLDEIFGPRRHDASSAADEPQG